VRRFLEFWPAVIGLLVACANTAPSLSRAERERLPMDGRQEIFDAENDLIIARNRADQARDQLQAVETSLDLLDAKFERNKKRLASQPASLTHIPLLQKAFTAHQVYLDARREVGRAEVEVAKQEIRIARVRLDHVVQRQLVRIGKAPLGSLDAFEKTSLEEEAKSKEARSSSLDLRTKAQALLDTWKNAQDDYARQTNDFDSGVWLE
jgi:hypothetical protein